MRRGATKDILTVSRTVAPVSSLPGCVLATVCPEASLSIRPTKGQFTSTKVLDLKGGDTVYWNKLSSSHVLGEDSLYTSNN